MSSSSLLGKKLLNFVTHLPCFALQGAHLYLVNTRKSLESIEKLLFAQLGGGEPELLSGAGPLEKLRLDDGCNSLKVRDLCPDKNPQCKLPKNHFFVSKVFLFWLSFVFT